MPNGSEVKILKPFLRWAGGKQNLVEELLKHAPPDELITKYWEPFLGAGSLFFANGFDNAVISDVNPHLINVYRKIKTDPKRIHRLIRIYETKFLKKEDFYYKVRNEFNKNLYKSNYVQAARFIFLLHSNYNGIYRVNRNGEYNVPIGKRRPSLPSLKNLILISKKLSGKKIVIHEGSYQTILNKVRKNQFIYIDPPYSPLDWDSQLQQFTSDKFNADDHNELARFANQLSKKGCYVMISNSAVPFIKQLYKSKKWRKKKLETTRWVSCKSERKKIAELLIMNY